MAKETGNEAWEIWGNAVDRVAGKVTNRRRWLVESGVGAARATLRLNYHRKRKENANVTYSVKWK